MQSISPVFTEKEVEIEQVVALGQEQYYPIVTAKIVYQDGSRATCVRFRFTDLERKAITEGADLILSQPHHSSMMPIGLQIAFPNEFPLEV